MNINLTLLAQALTFAAFIGFTVKFIWPFMLRAIETRQKTIADGLAAAEQGKKSLEISTRQAGQAVQEARSRAGEIVAQAEGEREKAAAKAEIEQEVSRAREQLRAQVAMLAVAGAEKILRREVDAKAHAQLLDSIKGQL